MMKSEMIVVFSRRDVPNATSARIRTRWFKDRVVGFSGDAYEDERCLLLTFGTVYRSSCGLTGLPEEIVLRAFARYGSEFPKHVEAEGPIFLYDKKEDTLHCVRDRFGVYSVFFCTSEDRIVVSTRIAPIFDLMGIEKRPNLAKNLLFVGGHYRHFDTPESDTFFEGVKTLEHAAHLVCTRDFDIRTRSYWDLELLDLSDKEYGSIKAEYRDLLRETVASRLANCTNPAFTISSGMDSSSVVAMASELLGRKLDLYTTTFAEKTEHDEADDIVPVAEKFGRSWNRIVVRGESLFGQLHEYLATCDEPLATVTQLMHRLVMKAVKDNGHDSLFGGIGGDEANCGEIEEYLFYFADLRRLGEDARLRHDMVNWANYHGHPLYPKNAEVLDTFFKNYIDFEIPGRNFLMRGRYDQYMDSFNRDFREAHYRVPELAHPYKSYLLNKLYQDLFTEAIPCALKAESFNAKCLGVKLRAPYLDAKIMQYGFSIPLLYKYRDGGTKAVIRDAMDGILPKETTSNFIKRGWNAPVNEWFRTSLGHKIREILENPTARQSEVYDISRIRHRYDAHIEGHANHMMFFWQFLNYEMWMNLQFG